MGTRWTGLNMLGTRVRSSWRGGGSGGGAWTMAEDAPGLLVASCQAAKFFKDKQGQYLY